MLTAKSVGARLREFAEEKFKTVAGLCRALGKASSSLNPYISGKSLPGAKLQHQLRSLGCDIEWLMTGARSTLSGASESTFEYYARFIDSIQDIRVLKDMLRIAVTQIAELEGELAAKESGILRHIKALEAFEATRKVALEATTNVGLEATTNVALEAKQNVASEATQNVVLEAEPKE